MPNLFYKVDILFYILISSVGAFQFLYNLIKICYGQSVLDILVGYSIKVLTCLFLMMYEVQYFSMCFFIIYMLFWVKCLTFLPNYYYFFSLLRFENCSFVFWTQIFYQIYDLQMFSLCMWFVLLMC